MTAVSWKFFAVLFAALLTVGQTTVPAHLDPLADQTLTMLHDRRDTLKDFQADVVYDIYHARTDDHEGRTGNVHYINDPAAGPQFSVHFTEDTVDGKPAKHHEQDLVFDGRHVTMIDRRAMQFHQQDALPPGAKPGDAVTLKGLVPLPIGLDVNEITRNFEVTLAPSSDENLTVLKLVPREEARGDFDFKQLDLTVDKKLQLPIKIVRTDKKGDVTTVEFKDPHINTGDSKMIDTTPPKAAGWDIDIK